MVASVVNVEHIVNSLFMNSICCDAVKGNEQKYFM